MSHKCFLSFKKEDSYYKEKFQDLLIMFKIELPYYWKDGTFFDTLNV